MFLSLAAVLLVLLVSAADAVRDAWIRKGWWQRHSVKWIAFYPPLIWITVREIPPYWWIALAPLSWIAWRLAARYIGGVQWPTFWSQLVKKENAA